MTHRILIDHHSDNETHVAITQNDRLEYFYHENIHDPATRGYVYLAKIIHIEPSLQAAFVDYGNERHGFLPFSEVHSDYYKIPIEDQKNSLNEEKEPARVTYIDDATDIKHKLEGKNDMQSFDETQSSFEETPRDNKRNAKTAVPSHQGPYLIQEVIRTGQLVLVQVQKEVRKNKRGWLDHTHISLRNLYRFAAQYGKWWRHF